MGQEAEAWWAGEAGRVQAVTVLPFEDRAIKFLFAVFVDKNRSAGFADRVLMEWAMADLHSKLAEVSRGWAWWLWPDGRMKACKGPYAKSRRKLVGGFDG